ncbi:helix-turn-helix domain-containing protein [Leucobacter soli]|uniref:helix-turn-helix domain-containing protein n=1 Tax=Leucobacter soli TaxID=2812850 RepID=UPI00361C302E
MKVDGSRIRELRQKSGRTLQVLSEDAAISPSFLSQVERGSRSRRSTRRSASPAH